MKRSNKYSRTKGHNYERKIVQELKVILDTDNIYTTRYASRMLDDLKVDILLPSEYNINIQAKSVESLSLNKCRDILDSMPDTTNSNIIFHKKKYKDDLVIMKKEDFYKYINCFKTK